MPKLNKLLVTSIIADIRECVHVSNEIYSWLGDIEHLSWKFPTKTAKGINAMEIVKEHDGTAGEFYILLLELAYDRLFGTFLFFVFAFSSLFSLSLTTLFPFVFLASIAPRFLFARTRRGTTREVGQGKSFGGFFLSCARKNTRDERRASAWSFYRGVHTVHTIQLGV